MHKPSFVHRRATSSLLTVAPLLVAAGMIACSSGSSSPSGNGSTNAAAAAPTPVAVDRSQPLSGDDFALGLLGDPALSGQTTFDAQDAQVHALDLDIVAEVDADHPGALAEVVNEIYSGDATKIATAITSVTTLLQAASASATLDARIHADPVFANVPESTTAQMDERVVYPDGLVTGGDAGLVHDAGMLICNPMNAPHLGKVNGMYGDSYTGALGAAHDLLDLPDPSASGVATRAGILGAIDAGKMQPPVDSRLGAYASTAGNASGTVGHAVHTAIGTIYMALGNYGQEYIGRVFKDPQAKALYSQPVSSCSSVMVATIEHNYWSDVKTEDPYSAGGQLGSAFNPYSRDLLQKYVFNNL